MIPFVIEVNDSTETRISPFSTLTHFTFTTLIVRSLMLW